MKQTIVTLVTCGLNWRKIILKYSCSVDGMLELKIWLGNPLCTPPHLPEVFPEVIINNKELLLITSSRDQP